MGLQRGLSWLENKRIVAWLSNRNLRGKVAHGENQRRGGESEIKSEREGMIAEG